ncbi:right-handed parallel beta-helix repeat-containing protein [Roseiterribacter gracilis]|uniref:Right handed beta helix domain-containing protein n=1 Tax=Roseiterribacter gracilis TaxID=2812848 RepID=A0A8S8XCN6_9PROT|nr:hypothetical protein TMPK1_12840 [Rhodospirillales bacterium TMPK1]
MPKTMWVGANETYKSLNDAIKASTAGDTINVRAGTYYETSASIDHDLTIVGVGGMVKLVNTQSLANGKAMLISHGNVTLKNLDMSGAKVGAGNGAAVRLSDGNLKLDNVFIHDNQDGILTLDNATATLTVNHSEFARNGVGDGYSHGIYANHIASVTITDSYFHDTKVGHHVKSRAANTTVTGTIFDDGSGGTSSYAIDLPNGGKATIENNWFHQASTSQNPLVVHFGGEGGYYATNKLHLDHDVLVNDLSGGTFAYNGISGASAEIDHVATYGTKTTVFAGTGSAHDNSTLASAMAKPAWSLWSVGADGSTSGIASQTAALIAAVTGGTVSLPADPAPPTTPPPTTVSTDFTKAAVITPTQDNQVMSNASGNDSFTFVNLSVDHTTIVHFYTKYDHFDLRALGLGTNALSDGHVTLQAAGTDTIVFVDSDAAGAAAPVQLVKIQGVTPTALAGADWHF